jgi:HTH-type transcriptional regulator, competence development regulator
VFNGRDDLTWKTVASLYGTYILHHTDIEFKGISDKIMDMSGFQTVDGEKLKALRQERMLSQRDVARMIGSTQATVSALELGARTAQPRTVRKLADALGVEPKALLKEGDQ